MQKLPDDIEYIIDDALNSKWYYSLATDAYYRLYPNRTYTNIFRKYLPDPEVLLNKKIEVYKKGGPVNIDALKSTPAVYALWNHNKVLENN